MSLKKYIEQEFDVHKLVVKLLKQLLEKNFKPTRINCAVDIKFDPYFKKKKAMCGTVLLSKQQKSLPGWEEYTGTGRNIRGWIPELACSQQIRVITRAAGAPGSTEAGGETPSDPSILSCEWGQLGSLPAASSL